MLLAARRLHPTLRFLGFLLDIVNLNQMSDSECEMSGCPQMSAVQYPSHRFLVKDSDSQYSLTCDRHDWLDFTAVSPLSHTPGKPFFPIYDFAHS